jgi:crossover junction endodeoxyribonuclease RuvC
VRIFGIDPGSERTGYGCVETDGRRHQLIACGAITAAAGDSFPHRLARIHRQLAQLLAFHRPECVAVESVFHAVNARSAIKLGHARGVAILAAVEAGCEVVEYTPAEIKRAVVGYGRAEKHQVQQMIKLLLGLPKAPTPHDAADALAVAICHLHSHSPAIVKAGLKAGLYRGVVGADLQVGPGVPDPSTGSGSPRAESRGDKARPTGSGKPRTWRQYRPPAHG